MINSNGARKYRTAIEAEGRAAAERGDWEVWMRAIGKVAALDHCLSDEEDLPPASQRIPFTK
jgi:hypothetical protein